MSSSPRIVTVQSYVMDESLYAWCLHFSKQEQIEAKQWKFFGTLLLFLRQKWQMLKMTLPQKNGHRIKTPTSKLMILVSSCWKKNFIRNNAHNFFILSLVFLKLLIVGVAFFLVHPVYLKICMPQVRSRKCV